MWPRTLVMVATIASAVAFSAALARAQDASAAQRLEAPIGKVISVTGSATIEHTAAVVLQASVPTGAAQAKVDDFVYRGDVVQTAADGKIALTFTDGTSFNLSKNGRMVLNEFVYDPNGKSNSTLFSLAKGNFTFVAGKVAKTGNMTFDTPVATMGIRGTTPNVEIADDGSVRFSTLVEGKKDVGTTTPALNQRTLRVAPTRQRQARTVPRTMSPEQASSYNRLFDFNIKLCKGC